MGTFQLALTHSGLVKLSLLKRIAVKTRPSALGMSDPICGPLIHNFVDETYEDKVDYENSVYSRILKTE